MLDNIKKRIADNSAVIMAKNNLMNDDTAMVAEYAQMFQELEELSVDGDNERKLDLMLDDDGKLEHDPIDDIELEEIGYNLKTGTIDVLSDAAIQTEYAMMKSKDHFISESENLIELDNEDVDSYDERRMKYADKRWMMYRQQVLQEGSFGYKRVSATADSVPSFASINFGDDNGSPYHVRMEIQHQVDKNGNITRHQLESIYLAESCHLCENLMDQVKDDLCEIYHISESANIWDSVVPSILVAPIDPIDKHSVIVGFKNNRSLSGLDFYRFTNPVCEYDTSSTYLEHAEVERLDNDKVRTLSKFCITKNRAIKESYKPNPRYHVGIFQEAIDIGGGDNNSAPAPDANNQGSTPPAMDGSDSNNNAGSNDNNAQEPTKIEVATNDVSDDIAKAASQATAENNTPDTGDNNSSEPTEGDDATTDDMPSIDDDSSNMDSGMDSTDMGNTPDIGDSTADPDAMLNDINTQGSEEAALDDTGIDPANIDVENMSISELIEHGTEALKAMSIGQLKEFIANSDNASITEAFILTNANINDEVDILLKKTLGVLNDNKIEINQLVNEFKKYGKKLNRVLTKASKSPKVYNKNEIDNMKKLNKCLADLMVTIKASTDKSSIQVIKRLMKAFTSQAAVVGKIVEKKKKELPKATLKNTKSIQESNLIEVDEFDYFEEAFFTTAKTARENILIRSGRVSTDMAKIVRAAENDKLSRGMVQKMYGGITKQITTNVESGSSDDTIRTGYATTRDYHIDSPEMNNLTNLISLINKITKKAAKREKWSIAFSGSEFSTLNKLKDYVNEFAEDTEYLLADETGTSEKLLKALAKEAKTISDVCKKISEWPRSIT